MNYPSSLDTGSTLQNSRATGNAIPASDHNDLANAVIALETKLGAEAAPASGASSGQVLTADGSGNTAWEDPTGGGSSPTDFTQAVNQTAHGLSVGNVIHWNGTAFVKAQALYEYGGDHESDVYGVVTTVTDANNFVVTTSGMATGLSGLTPGSMYYLSEVTAGLLTVQQPTADSTVVVPVLIAKSATTGQMAMQEGVVNVVARPYSRMGINFGYSTQSNPQQIINDLQYLSRYTHKLRMSIPSYNDSTGIANVRAIVLLANAMGFETSYGITAAATSGGTASTVAAWLAQVPTEAAWAFANGVDMFFIGNEEDWSADDGGITGITSATIQTEVLALAATLKGDYPTGMKIVYSTAEGEFLAWDAIGNGGNANWQYLDAFGINMYNSDFPGTLTYALSLGFGSKLFLSEWAPNQTYVAGGDTASVYEADVLARRNDIVAAGIDAFWFTWDWGGSYETSSDWGFVNGDNTFKPGFAQLFGIPR